MITDQTGFTWPANLLTNAGVIFARVKISFKKDSFWKIILTGLHVRHMAAIIVITRTASMLISSGITGIIREVTKNKKTGPEMHLKKMTKEVQGKISIE